MTAYVLPGQVLAGSTITPLVLTTQTSTPAISIAVPDWSIAQGESITYPSNGATVGQIWPEYIGPDLPSRTTVSHTTGSLEYLGTATATLTMTPSYQLLKIQTSRPARVRLYDSTAHRTADASRPIGTDPVNDHGVMMEFVTTGAMLTASISPAVDGYTSDAGTSVPMAVQNLGTTGTVQVTLTYIQTEA